MAKLHNRDRVLAKLSKLPKVARATLGQALRESAAEIVEAQKRAAPVDDGDLRNSIKATAGGANADADLTIRITAGDEKAFYALMVEFGTAPHINGGKFAGTQHPGSAARPFFYGPYRALKRKTKNKAGRAIGKAVRAIAGS